MDEGTFSGPLAQFECKGTTFSVNMQINSSFLCENNLHSTKDIPLFSLINLSTQLEWFLRRVLYDMFN